CCPRCGAATGCATRTWSRCTSATCAASSAMTRAVGGGSGRCAASVTASAPARHQRHSSLSDDVTMLVTTHVLAGAAIGALVRRPVAAFGLGVVSHFVMDAVPHWGSGDDHDYFMTVAVRDGLAGLAALAGSTALSPRGKRWAVLAGAMGAATPDLDK